MAIVKIEESTEKLDVSINNGDLKAIVEIKEKWEFKDKESVLRFALAALLVAEEGELCVIKKDGSKKTIKPIEELLQNKNHPNEPKEGMMHG